MRTEVKIGLVIGLVVIVVGVIYGVSRARQVSGKVADVVPMDAPAARVATPAGKGDRTEPPKPKTGDTRPLAPAKTPLTSPPPVAAGTPRTGAEGAPPPARPLTTPPPAATRPHVMPAVPPATDQGPATAPTLPPVLPPLVATPDRERPSETETAATPPTRSPGVAPPPRKEEVPLTPAPAPPVPVSGPTRHVVQEGESLWSIAQETYGDGHQWPRIKAANPGIDENNIKAGQVLLLPPKEGAASQQEPRSGSKPEEPRPVVPGTATPETRPDAGARTYIVEEGDTLIKIARKALGNPGLWPKILDLNKDKLARPEDLKAGMEIRLPPAKESRNGKEAPATKKNAR